MVDLVIDRLARLAESAPTAPLFPERRDGFWPLLTHQAAWAGSGAVASWLIAQGFGPAHVKVGVAPAGRSLAVRAPDSPQRALLLLGALRAGAPVVDTGASLAFVAAGDHLVTDTGIALAALANASIDAAVAERRLHLDAATPARIVAGTVRRHGDFATIAEAVG